MNLNLAEMERQTETNPRKENDSETPPLPGWDESKRSGKIRVSQREYVQVSYIQVKE